MIDTSLILWLGALLSIAAWALVVTRNPEPDARGRGLWVALAIFSACQLAWIVPIIELWNVRAQPWF